jgi:uncharacterized membrane protein
MRRLESIDILRGLLMILMALDHARDYFTSVRGINPTDPLHSWPALFATRWITHLCAPGFIALAGTSVFLQRKRGKPAQAMARLLASRGLWLMFLEITLISFGWSFSLAPALQVIWVIGIAMIFLATLQWLPTAVVGAIGAAIVLSHNLLDGIRTEGVGGDALLWRFFHQQGPIFLHGQMVGFILYPIVPWIGVICLGYAFGPIAAAGPLRRQKLSILLAVALLFAFTLLRIFHGYGDDYAFQHLATPAETAMSFLEVEKYPPSLQYLLATLGVLLLLYALFDRAVTSNWARHLRAIVETYGRVPFFYYVLHIYILHGLALALTAERGMNWRFWLIPGAFFLRHLDGWGYSLPGVYLIWSLTVLALYFPCRWFANVKARRRDWWLSYL